MSYNIPATKVNRIRIAFIKGKFNQTKLAAELGIARNTLLYYLNDFRRIKELYPERIDDLSFVIKKTKYVPPKSARYHELIAILPELVKAATTVVLQLKPLHEEYLKRFPNGFGLGNFSKYYIDWRRRNNICKFTHRSVKSISDDDMAVLKTWKTSFKHDQWRKALVILNSYEGKKLQESAKQVNVCWITAQKWVDHFNNKGLAGLPMIHRGDRPDEVIRINIKKANLIRLIHESPKLHNINRTTWRQEDLEKAYIEFYGHRLSTSTIGKYLKQEGFNYNKAKIGLTSNDPKFREKLANIQRILGNLKDDERFFSIDEYGPFSLRPKGGRSFMQKGHQRYFNPDAKSNGCLICTAAIELSTNQVTHFFSPKKNTEEMIKLFDILCKQYIDMKKLYFSWDAATWHNSKKVMQHIELLNSNNYRTANKTPEVELAPLPSKAQFLNVIESVFSGLAKSVVHNSYYSCERDCILAINKYFAARNEHFLKNPKRAGKKIWGKEIVAPIFKDTNNCKDAGFIYG